MRKRHEAVAICVLYMYAFAKSARAAWVTLDAWGRVGLRLRARVASLLRASRPKRAPTRVRRPIVLWARSLPWDALAFQAETSWCAGTCRAVVREHLDQQRTYLLLQFYYDLNANGSQKPRGAAKVRCSERVAL